MNYEEAIRWIYTTQRYGIRLGLANMWRLVGTLGLRVEGPKAPAFIHVAGTNGKGSVCAMLDAICRAAGLRTGLFTSPHLVTFRERMRINGQMISELDVALGLRAVRKVIEGWQPEPTFFEITTALALAYFQRVRCDVVILETGLGGRLDATNVVMPKVSVITPIGFDHQEWLGSSLPEIAFEKAGIIKSGVPVVTSPQVDDVLCLLGHLSIERDAPFNLVVTPLDRVKIALRGDHQRWNAALAVHALEAGGFTMPKGAIAEGLANVDWMGRFQRVRQRIILDGAHNPAAAEQLADTWRSEFGAVRAAIVLGAMKDKDVRGVVAALAPIASQFISVPIHNSRAHSATEIASIVQTVAPRLKCHIACDIESALARAESDPDPILITGSFFLVGEALSHLGIVSEKLEISTQ